MGMEGEGWDRGKGMKKGEEEEEDIRISSY